MSTAETKFISLVNKFSSADEDVYLGKMMSSPGLKYKDKVFAFFTKDEAMGFRLGENFDIKKASVQKHRPLSPFKKKPPLKGWYIIDKEESNTWEELTEHALSYTKTL